MDSRRSGGMPVVGGSSLLVIFAVLCLTVFALLSISTAQANTRLSQAGLTAVEQYYAADCAAERIFAQLRGGVVLPEVAVEGQKYCYTCPVSDTQNLSVELRRDGDTWTVLRWQTVSAVEWEPDTSLDVWDGEEE